MLNHNIITLQELGVVLNEPFSYLIMKLLFFLNNWTFFGVHRSKINAGWLFQILGHGALGDPESLSLSSPA